MLNLLPYAPELGLLYPVQPCGRAVWHAVGGQLQGMPFMQRDERRVPLRGTRVLGRAVDTGVFDSAPCGLRMTAESGDSIVSVPVAALAQCLPLW